MNNIYTLTLNSAIEQVIYAIGDSPKSIDKILSVQEFFTGKAVNTGLVLSNLGVFCNINIVCGQDTAVEYSHMKNKYRNIIITTVNGKTRKNQTYVFQNGKEYKIINTGYSLTEKEISPLKNDLLKRIEKDDILLVSGSLPAGISADWYSKLIRNANRKGVKVFFDVGKDVLNVCVKSHPFYIKPNEEELKDIIGEYKKEILPKKIKEISEHYHINNVILTLGNDGVLAYKLGDKSCIHVFSTEKFPDRIMTTGCGDSFNAGFIYKIVNSGSFLESVIYGTAVASANIFDGFPEKICEKTIEQRLKYIKYKIV